MKEDIKDLLIAIDKFRASFVIAVGDKSPFAKIALKIIDDAVNEVSQQDDPVVVQHRRNRCACGAELTEIWICEKCVEVVERR